MMSDIVHVLKRFLTILASSDINNEHRYLLIPYHLVQMALKRFPMEGDTSGADEIDTVHGSTAALEAYARTYGRFYELLGDGKQPPWTTSDPAKDPRLHELLLTHPVPRAQQELACLPPSGG